MLARYFVPEDDSEAATERQRRAARDLIESGRPCFRPKRWPWSWSDCCGGTTASRWSRCCRCSTTCWPIPASRQKTDQPWSWPWPVCATGSTSLMPCTMRAAAVARRWRHLMTAALCGAFASTISRHACLCRQVPELGGFQLQDASLNHPSRNPSIPAVGPGCERGAAAHLTSQIPDPRSIQGRRLRRWIR